MINLRTPPASQRRVRYRRLLATARDERGAATAQIVIATPVLLFMLLVIVQFAIWSQATHVAQAAASQALEATRVSGGTSEIGQTEAQNVLDQLDTGPLAGSTIHVTRTATTATVSITGTAESIVPFLHLPVHAEASGQTEQFTIG
jgi:Flp pilus assembly protein TadG